MLQGCCCCRCTWSLCCCTWCYSGCWCYRAAAAAAVPGLYAAVPGVTVTAGVTGLLLLLYLVCMLLYPVLQWLLVLQGCCCCRCTWSLCCCTRCYSDCWCYRAAAAAVPGLYAAVPGVTVAAGVTGLLLLPLYLVFMLLYPVLQWLLVLQGCCCCRCTWSVCCCTRCYSGCWCYRAAAAAVPGLYAAVPGVTVTAGVTGLLLLLYLVCMLLYPVLQWLLVLQGCCCCRCTWSLCCCTRCYIGCWCYRAAAAAVPGLYAAVPGVTVAVGVTGLLLLPLYLVCMLLYPVLQWLLVLQGCCCCCTWSVCCCTRCYSDCWCYRAAAAAVPGLYAAAPGVTVAAGVTGLLLLPLYLVFMLLYPVLHWLLVLQACCCCCRCTWSVCCCTRCYSGCWCYRAAAAAAVPGLYAAVPGVTVAVGVTGLLLLPLYLVFLVLVGVPLLLLEVAVGQYTSRGVWSAWNIAPLFKGRC